MIAVKNLSKKFFLTARESITVLNNLTFAVEAGSWTSLMGPSGSGKSTLLSLLAGLDNVTEGSIVMDGTELSSLEEEERAHFRAHAMGFIFQSFRLLPTLTALENVCVPLEILGRFDSEARAKALLERVGLGQRIHHLPSQLSGGEQQRVAIARAFVSQPKILFADEPTGNLDSKNGSIVLDLMAELHKEHKTTLFVVTHDPLVAARGEKEIHLKDGVLVTS